MKSKKLEEGLIFRLNYKKIRKAGSLRRKIVHAIIQEFGSGQILMSAYVDRKAVIYSLKNKIIAFWSTSRDEFWIKGKTSGNYLDLVEALGDCDLDTVLFIVKLHKGGVCHTKDENGNFRKSCFYRRIVIRKGKLKLKLIKK